MGKGWFWCRWDVHGGIGNDNTITVESNGSYKDKTALEMEIEFKIANINTINYAQVKWYYTKHDS